MIGVGFVRVEMRYLSDGERCQQDEAQNRYCREKSGAGAAFAAENCAKSCQLMKPSSSILQKAHRSLDAPGMERLHRSYNSGTTGGKTLSTRVKTGIRRRVCHSLSRWMALPTKIGPDEADSEGCGGSTAEDDNECMARFAQQPEGLGPIFPISSFLVARRHPVSVAPLTSNCEKLAASATCGKVNGRL